jgi:hypothetical protein
MNKRHKVTNLVINTRDWLTLPAEDQSHYVDTIAEVNHTILTQEDVIKYLEFYD